MNCNCNKVIMATSYINGTTFNINTDFSINDIENGDRFILVLPIDLPAMTTLTQVYVVITINGVSTTVPVQDIIGNNLMSDQLRFFNRVGNCKCNRKSVIRMVYGSNPSHFKVLQCLPESSAVPFDVQGGNVNGTKQVKQN